MLTQPRKKLNERSLNAAECRAEFAEKNAVLMAKFEVLSPLGFYDFLFQGDLKEKTYVIENTTYASAHVTEILQIALFRSDVYIPPCSFFNGTYRQCCMEKVYALVLDIDNLTPAQLLRLIEKINHASSLPRPIMIVNSGSGVHLYFCFEAPAEAYKRRIPILRTMLAQMSNLYSGYGKMDRHSLLQPFRPAGSQTKLGDIASAYLSGQRWNISSLAGLLDIDVTKWERNTMPNKEEIQSASSSPAPKKKTLILPRTNNKDKLFWYCGERIFKNTDLGSRYLALFGLAIVGYKCRVPRDIVVREMESLITCWNEKNPDVPVEISEIRKAMKGYSQRYVLVSATQLEEWFGWLFERKIPRRGRTQEEHLEIARAIKDASQKVKKKQAITKYLKQNPSATTREIAAALRMSLSTVGKYKKLIKY